MSAPILPPGLPAPRPSPDGLDGAYWAAAQRGELTAQRCRSCRAWQWGPEWICHRCHSFELAFERVPGRGRIYSWERAWHPVHPSLREAVPYVAVVVELPEAGGIRMLGNLSGDARAPVEIGAAVEPLFEHHADADPAYTLVQWKRV